MKHIFSIAELTPELGKWQSSWLLLYKKSFEQSDCAATHFEEVAATLSGVGLFMADVGVVRDIHPVYEINSVPALLEFRENSLVNVYKGCHQPGQYRALVENAVFSAKRGGEERAVKNVVVYSTPTCSWCHTLKRHLDVHGIKYRDIDVSKDPKAAETMVRKSGQQGVPQTEINGQMIVGFDRERINNLLQIS